VFSRLAPVVEGAAVLDLFCASGALGIEALSRGAAMACFIDAAEASLRTVRGNLAGLEVSSSIARVARRSVPAQKLPADWPHQFDIVLADPPYDEEFALLPVVAFMLEQAQEQGIVVLEHSIRHPESAELARSDAWRRWTRHAPQQRRYGETAITTIVRQAD
jgi:16S rRNA (guanine966-N2)-methyltransferase